MNWPQYNIRNLQTYKRCKSYCLFLLTTWLSWEWLIKWAWWWQLWRDWGDCLLACCVPRRRDTLQLQLNTNLGLAWLALATLGQRNWEWWQYQCAGGWEQGWQRLTNRSRSRGTETGRMSVASYSEFPHSLLWPLHGIQSTVINNQPHFLLVLHKDSRSRLWQCCSFYFSSAKQKMNICQHLVPGWHWAARSCGLWCDHEVLVTIVVSVTSYAETLVLSN